MHVHCALLLALTVALALRNVQAQDYPVVVANLTTCPIPRVNWAPEDNVSGTTQSIIPIMLGWLSKPTVGYVTPQCVNGAIQNLPVCLEELTVKEGCCLKACSDALKSTDDCLKQLIASLCTTNDTTVKTVIKPLFTTAHRCVYSKEIQCEDYMKLFMSSPPPRSSPPPKRASSPPPKHYSPPPRRASSPRRRPPPSIK